MSVGYIRYLHDLFESFGPITTRKMFGGYGVYHEGLMFALIADESLYLKADVQNVGHFEQRGLDPFLYEKNGKEMRLSYYRAPDEMMDDRAIAAEWAGRSYEAAVRAYARRH